MMRFGKFGTRALGAVLLVGALASCDLLGPDDRGPEGPGAFQATLVSPAGAEGSAVFEIRGGVQLSTISPDNGQAFYDHQADVTRLVVVLNDPGTIRFQVRTQDVAVMPTATVLQVADGNDELRSSLDGYSVELEAAPDPDKGWER